MTEDELRAWLTLWRTPGVGSRGFQRLLADHDGATPARVLARPPAWLDEPVRQALREPDEAGVDRDLAWLAASADNHILVLTDPGYPALLRSIDDPPPLLFVHGDPERLRDPQLAMVGSRNPSPGGARNAGDFARHLASAGLTITSGLALGIDAASHEGALAVAGQTLAVMGTGLDRVYPARHRELAHRIVESGGALISEFPIGSPARAEHFPRRNRLISGLSLGVLVVEAAVRSGSLITARQALEQGREVFAIPGSIHNPMARGCHALLRQGAKLVETGTDVLEELHALAGLVLNEAPAQAPQTDPDDNDSDHAALLDHLGHDPVTVDQLVTASGLTPEAVSSMLLILELEGRVASQAGAYVRLTRS